MVISGSMPRSVCSIPFGSCQEIDGSRQDWPLPCTTVLHASPLHSGLALLASLGRRGILLSCLSPTRRRSRKAVGRDQRCLHKGLAAILLPCQQLAEPAPPLSIRVASSWDSMTCPPETHAIKDLINCLSFLHSRRTRTWEEKHDRNTYPSFLRGGPRGHGRGTDNP